MSELHREAAVGVILDVHNFCVVGQDEKLTTSEVKAEVEIQSPHGSVFLGVRNVSVDAGNGYESCFHLRLQSEPEAVKVKKKQKKILL